MRAKRQPIGGASSPVRPHDAPGHYTPCAMASQCALGVAWSLAQAQKSGSARGGTPMCASDILIRSLAGVLDAISLSYQARAPTNTR